MQISSKSNKTIKLVKKLHQKKYQKKESLFLLEGENLIMDALKAGLNLHYLFHLPGFKLRQKPGSGVNIYEVTTELMQYFG